LTGRVDVDKGGGRGRSGRFAALIAAVCVASLVIVALADSPVVGTSAVADTTTTTTPPDTTTTTPPDTTTTTTPPDTTTTTPPDTTTTTAPASDTTTTTIPAPPGIDFSKLIPAEPLPPQQAFIYVTDSQRALLQQLQTASDILAVRHFALLGLARQLVIAKDHLKVARDREEVAVAAAILEPLGAAIDRGTPTTPVLKASATSDVALLELPNTRAESGSSVADAQVAALDELTRRLESERKSARRAVVEAEAAVAALNGLVAVQTKFVSDAVATRSAAKSAVTNEFGSDDGLQAHADGITAVLAAAQAGQPDPVVLGGIAPPIPGATLGSPFGIRVDPLGGGVGFHPGLDFEAASGTPIEAAAAGVVVMAGDCGGYGNCVVIDHGTSVATLYGHQSEVLTQVGDHVEAGQVIGLVGSTGMSTGPHLHFELRVHGIPIDPLTVLGN
jgi:murein DD-endopeptidase MepM/ murein hydrolase activator NlpD